MSKIKIINDNGCGWLNHLQKRTNIKTLNNDLKSDYLIIGAGYTGLSVARKLSEIETNKKIVIIDAELAGEGGSSRNSGYLVDTTLNDGFTSNKDLKEYKKKVKIYDMGIKAVRKYVKEYQVDCDWNDSGKYFASSKFEDENKAKQFSNLLTSLNFKNEILYKEELKKRLGTSFYNIGVYTNGGVLLNPGKLARSMIYTLPEQVELYENTRLLNWKKINDKIECQFAKNKIITNNIIFCANGFLRSLNIKKNYNFPITLTASLTRPLSENEFKSIGFDIIVKNELMLIESIPFGIEKNNVEEVIENILNEDFNTSNDFSASDFFAKRLSKITSIKSGQKLNSDEQEYIVNHLFSCKEPNLSPDNKQIFITLNKNDIENKFNG